MHTCNLYLNWCLLSTQETPEFETSLSIDIVHDGLVRKVEPFHMGEGTSGARFTILDWSGLPATACILTIGVEALKNEWIAGAGSDVLEGQERAFRDVDSVFWAC